MLALLTLFKLVGRSYAYASGFHGGLTIVPLPVPPYLPKPVSSARAQPSEEPTKTRWVSSAS